MAFTSHEAERHRRCDCAPWHRDAVRGPDARNGRGARARSRRRHSSCEMGNGVQHVISIVFDNVHFSRDNPNVPSDLEQMPHLLNFLTVQRHGAVQHAHAVDRAHRR